MISLPGGARIWLACGVTDMRKGFDGLAAIVQLQLAEDPFVCGAIEYVAAEHTAASTPRKHGNLLMSAAT